MDMTEGSAVKLLLIFSIPMLIGNIFQQIYNLADIIIVGRLIGKNAIASIGATNSISFFFFALCNGVATAISCMGLQFVVNGYGALATAAFTTTGKIEQIIHMPYQTLNAALATFCGQNYGAKKIKRVISGYRKGMLIMAIYTVCGILNGVGDAFFSMLNGIVEVIGRFTVPFILTAIPAIGVWGIWWSVGVVWALAGITAYWRYLVVKKQIIRQYGYN